MSIGSPIPRGVRNPFDNPAFGVVYGVNVRDSQWGAAADGVTDDTPAFRRAMAGMPSGGGRFYIPTGTYALEARSIATVFTVSRSNVTVCGDGHGTQLIHTLTGITDSPLTGIITVRQNGANVENVTIRDLRITGPSAYVGGQSAFHEYGNNAQLLSGIHIGDSSSNTLKYVTVENVTVEKVEGQGIGATGPGVYDGSGVHHLHVRNNLVKNTRGWGILVFGGTVYDTIITGNTVERIEGHAIESAGAGGNFIYGNQVIGPAGHGIVVTGNNNAALSPIHKNVIENNYVTELGTAYWSGATAAMGILINNESGANVYNATVRSNQIFRTEGSGIVVSGHNGATVRDIVIADNTIQEVGGDATQPINQYGIRFADATYTLTSAVIRGNHISTNAAGYGMTYGIFIPAAVDFSAVDISENTIHTATVNAIFVRSNPTDLRIGWNDHNGVWKFNHRFLVNFIVLVTNDGGTIKHSYRSNAATVTAPSMIAGAITGWSTTATATPQVAAGVDFANGAGVNAAVTYSLVLRSTNAQAAADDVQFTTAIEYNSTGTELHAYGRAESINVNGTTQVWPTVNVLTSAGAAYPLTAANIPAGTSIGIRVTDYIK